jgi:hypothetical protein
MKSKRPLPKKPQTYMCENRIISKSGYKTHHSIKTCDNPDDDCSVLNDTKYRINDLTLLSKQIKSQKDYNDIIREIQKNNYCVKWGDIKTFYKSCIMHKWENNKFIE